MLLNQPGGMNFTSEQSGLSDGQLLQEGDLGSQLARNGQCGETFSKSSLKHEIAVTCKPLEVVYSQGCFCAPTVSGAAPCPLRTGDR